MDRRSPQPAQQTLTADQQQAIVPGQLGRMPGRAVPAKVLRRGAQDQPRRGQLPADERGHLEARNADRHIEALVDQIDQDIAAGMERSEAIIGAAVRRFRPITLTALKKSTSK